MPKVLMINLGEYCLGSQHVLINSFTVTLQGNASGGDRARLMGQMANSLIRTAWSFIGRESVLPRQLPSGSFAF